MTAQTIEDFGEQWSVFRDNPGYYGSVDLLADLFGPLLSVDEVKGTHVAEIGSGTGRIVNMLLDAGANHVWAVEPSVAMGVLKENTAERKERVTYLRDVGEALPPDLLLDLVVSIGVLHHIPAPGPVVRAAYNALKPGGRLFVWVYGREGDQTYLRLAEPMRRISVRLPHGALVSLSFVLGWVLDGYIAMCHFLPLPMHAYMRGVLAKFPRSVRRLTIYDQLNPAYAKYYRKDEAQALVGDQGFADVRAYQGTAIVGA